ncbi:hypothetical protein NHP200010_14150 [Helicobacter bizzozeronii]|uniref:hypothetical protein n=1 Tax=Helicobacter bizzozeronii TaxID=56877 RepID=UPI00244D8BA3|nr:hypothetical protein [Helicobacter bizzozeronii]GMB93688.1 hypothetical protein NHP200010_14150 [Helicobacter bizzozeronii]
MTKINSSTTCIVPAKALSMKNLRFLTLLHKVGDIYDSMLIGYLRPKGNIVRVSLLIPFKEFMRYAAHIYAKPAECRGFMQDGFLTDRSQQAKANKQEMSQAYHLSFTLGESFMEELMIKAPNGLVPC